MGRFDLHVTTPWFGARGGRPEPPMGLRDALRLLRPLFPELTTGRLYELLRSPEQSFQGLSEDRMTVLFDAFLEIGKRVRVVDNEPVLPEPPSDLHEVRLGTQTAIVGGRWGSRGQA